MDTKKKIEYWLDTAHYDLVSAKAMLEAKRFLYGDKKIVEIARLYAQKVASYMPIKMVILYGSYARGTAKKSSDIDVAVVVDKFQGDYLKAGAELFNLVRGVNKRIEPVLLCRKHDRSGFLESILKQGKIIYKV